MLQILGQWEFISYYREPEQKNFVILRHEAWITQYLEREKAENRIIVNVGDMILQWDIKFNSSKGIVTYS